MPYVDSRGVSMETMTFSEALNRLVDLAEGNLPDEHDIAREPALKEEGAWQSTALATVRALAEGIDDLFDPPAACRDWPVDVTRSDRSDDPCDPASAVRIAFAMAKNAMPDPMNWTEQSIAAADEFDLDAQALDLAEDLLGLHRGILRVAPSAPGFR